MLPLRAKSFALVFDQLRTFRADVAYLTMLSVVLVVFRVNVTHSDWTSVHKATLEPGV